MKTILPVLILLSILMLSCSSADKITLNEVFNEKAISFNENLDNFKETFHLPRSVKLDNSSIDTSNQTITLEFNKDFAVIPFEKIMLIASI